MLITNSWTSISSGECLVTKNGTKMLRLAYASSTPTSESTIPVTDNTTQRFPLVTGKQLWAQAVDEDVSITVDIL